MEKTLNIQGLFLCLKSEKQLESYSIRLQIETDTRNLQHAISK